MKYFLIYLFPAFLLAQTPTIQWQKIFSRPDNSVSFERLMNIVQTTDGGYIMSGGSSSYIPNTDQDFYIVKTDAQGNLEWQKIIGGNALDYLPYIKQTTDGGYIIGGTSASNISGQKTQNSKGSADYWILKLDALGNIVWQKTIGGSSPDVLASIEQTTDGGYILGGESESNISGDKTEHRIGYIENVYQGYSDYWVVKINSIGDIEWQNTIGGDNGDFGGNTIQTQDGGYIVTGTSYSAISGDKSENNMGSRDYWVVKLDSTGVIEWENTIGGDDKDECYAVIESADGGYVIGGRSWSSISGDKTEALSNPNFSGWVLKLNGQGNIVWQNTIGGDVAETLASISQTIDGGYILALYSNSGVFGDKTEISRGATDYWIVKIDANGTVLWDKTIGGSANDVLTDVIQTSDGGYMLAGLSQSPISGDKTSISSERSDFWIVKLSPENLTTKNFTTTNVQVYPNPTTKMVSINFPQQYKKLAVTVVTVLGQMVQEQKFTNMSKMNLDINGAKGIYFVNVVNENNEKLVFKVIKE